MFRSAAVALAFAGVVNAQSSSVISLFLPDTDQQTLVGSLIASVCVVPGFSARLETHFLHRMPQKRQLHSVVLPAKILRIVDLEPVRSPPPSDLRLLCTPRHSTP